MSRKNVLVLCTGNSCRSQMAEGLINDRLGTDYQAFSAGTRPSGYVHPKAIQVMSEVGIDLNQNQSKSTDAFKGQHFDYVITVCSSAQEDCPVWLDGADQKVHIGFEDPAEAIGTEEEILAVFRAIRDQIAAKIIGYLREELRTQSSAMTN